MCGSVCRIYLLLCSTYVMLLLNHQNTLSQKLRPSKWSDSVLRVERSFSLYKSNEEQRRRRDSPQINDNQQGQLGFRRNMETSCRDKCGQLFDLPCSCDIQCMVYKNCCEDLSLECPEMQVEAESLYTPELLNSQIECIHNGMLAISSCPKISSVGTANLSNTWLNEHRERMRRLQAALFVNESLTNTKKDSQADAHSDKQGQSVLQLLNDIPVSDISTGLLYKTPEIFSCNVGPQSEPAAWSVEIESREILGDIQKIQYATVENDQTKHIPPPQLPDDRAYRFCLPQAIGTCKHPQDKCGAFLSYVYVPEEPWLIYNNKYCAFCNGHEEIKLKNLTKYQGHRTKFVFSVLMKVSNEKLELSVIGDESRPWAIEWKKAKCNLLEEMEVKEKNQMSACNIDSCSNSFVLFHDGTCKYLGIVELALSDYGHIPFSVSAVTSGNLEVGQDEGSQKIVVGAPLRALPDLTRCVLEKNFGSDLGESEYPLRIRRDLRLNATMFIVDVQLYLTPGGTMEELKRSLSAMSMIAKALYLYNRTWYLTPRTKPVKSISSSSNANILEGIKTVDGDLLHWSNPFFMPAQNCSEVLNNFTVCVCQQIVPGSNGQRCSLICYEYVLCDHELEEVQAFSEAKCFSLFRRRVASCGISWTKNSLFMWFLIVLILLR